MANNLLFRIFAQDIGRNGYSGVTDQVALSPHAAVVMADAVYPAWRGKHIALPHDRKDMWPHPTTGRVPPEALKYK